MTGLSQVANGWPLVLSMAAAMTALGLRAGRRRSAINEALHELRRPLQAIALSASGGVREGRVESSMQLVSAALERLDREVNGGSALSSPEPVTCRPLVRAAVSRWQARAKMDDGSLELHWRAGEAVVVGDRAGLAQALDNLIVNAIEHGGPSIVVEAQRHDGRLRLLVADSGRGTRPESRRGNPADVIARLSGRRRRGHGLAVVQKVGSTHGGRFVLHRSEWGSVAVLELPLAVDADRAA